MKQRASKLLATLLVLSPLTSFAGENLFGYVLGAEPTPKGASEFYTVLTNRRDKGVGSYHANDLKFELEYGLTNRLTGHIELKGQSIDSKGIRQDGYFPRDSSYGMSYYGIGGALTYNFLSTAMDDIGLSVRVGVDWDSLDRNSGEKKDRKSLSTALLLQKYFMDGQLVWAGNLGVESTNAKRATIAGYDVLANNTQEINGTEWPNYQEMELEWRVSTGLSYRFAPNWYASAEAIYEEEHETVVGLERATTFVGPSLHYGDKNWWATLTWLQQVSGSGEKIAGQDDNNLYLIEKTKYETRLKVGYNF
jgi:hypothetical protein